MRVWDRGAGITGERRSTVITRGIRAGERLGKKESRSAGLGHHREILTVLAVSRLSDSSGFALESGVSPRMVIG